MLLFFRSFLFFITFYWPFIVFIDVEDIKYVINYDYPNTSEDYVHRIGRTGRKNKKGTAYTFFTKSDSKQANDLINVLREANQTVNPQLFEFARTGGGGLDKYRRYKTKTGFIPKNSFRGGFGGRTNDGNNYPAKRKFDSFDSASNAKKTHFDY